MSLILTVIVHQMRMGIKTSVSLHDLDEDGGGGDVSCDLINNPVEGLC